MTDAPRARARHPVRDRILLYSIAFVVTLGFMRFALARRVLFPGCPDALPAPGGAPLFPGASVVDYTTKDGVALRGAWVKSAKPSGRTVLYFHGNAESAASGLPLGAGLAERGTSVFLAEFRGYGGRPEKPSEEGIFRDGEAALELVLGSGVPESSLVLVGRSLGSGVAVELASKGHGAAVVLVSPYTSIVDVARTIVGPLAPLLVPDPLDSLSRIGNVRVPVVVVHGTADTLIPFALGKRLAEAAPHGRLVPVAGRGHNDLDETRLLAESLEALPR